MADLRPAEQREGALAKLPKEVYERLTEWKAKYQGIYAVSVCRKWYVYRRPTLGELRTFLHIMGNPAPSGNINMLELGGDNGPSFAMGIAHRIIPLNPFACSAQDYLIPLVVLYPADSVLSENMPQGAVSALVKAIVESAGFTDIKEMSKYIDEARIQSRAGVDDIIIAFICRGLNMKPSEVMALDIEGLSRHIALAETSLGMQLPVNFQQGQSRPKSNIFTDPRAVMPASVPEHTPGRDSAPGGVIDMDKENLELANLGFSEAHGMQTDAEIRSAVGQDAARRMRDASR